MFKSAPNIFKLFDFHNQILHGGCDQEYAPGQWGPARPVGYFSIKYRIKAAWMVFTGKADVIVWP